MKQDLAKERASEFYDGNLRNVMRPLEDSPWLPVYEAAADLLALGADEPLLDIGCGTGRFARLMKDRGHRAYLGFDFSAARVEEARRYVPEWDFRVADAFAEEARGWIRGARAFTALEFLEHVGGDRELIASLPAGAIFVFSVPNFDSHGHVRYFESAQQVRERYEDLLQFDPARSREILNPKREAKRTFVFRTVVRAR